MVRDGGQRRISRFAPVESLLLVKASGRAPHGGGRRTSIDSVDYRTLLAWIRDGVPERRGKTHGALADVRIEPGKRLKLGEPGTQQLRVLARYDDGHLRDVTRLASFKSLDDSSATVDSRRPAVALRDAPRPT